MLRKLLFQHINRIQLAAGMLGTVIGMFLLLLSVQLYLDTRYILYEKEDFMQAEYIVINKPVSVFSTFRQKRVAFTDKEINDLKAQPFVNRIASFISSNFNVDAYIEGNEDFPGFYSQLFFEALPDEYLDIRLDEWQWDKNSPMIPFIIPKDYLDLYNFGFSSAQDLPQLSENMINKIVFRIRIEGNNKNANFFGRIAGFSSRIQSILVPYDFLTWANKAYGNQTQENASRLIIEVKKPSDPSIYSYLDKMNYETNKDKIRNSKLRIFLNFLLAILSMVAVVIVFMAILVFMLSFQIILSRNAEKIRNLISIGYDYRKLRNFYLLRFLGLIILVGTLSLIFVYYSKLQYVNYLFRFGFETKPGFSLITVCTGSGLIILIFLVNWMLATKQLKKMN